ncbi:cytidine deaminase [Flavobacteriaceae bacterium]|jgi:cytidine deaminase|nr:cytidine deaminase [Flavobacteriaceae bacterium]MDC1493015.1 cytidine deaminase [Flavobacteriaceae bacterium]
MKKVSINSNFSVFDTIDDLPVQAKTLFESAKKIRKTAYSKYSNFSVGVAVLLDNGEIISGTNQENAAYPSGMCAERTALFYANSKYPDSTIVCLAIVAGSNAKINETPIAPCGGCRQVISEFESKQSSPIGMYFMGEIGKIVFTESIENLLPFRFDSSFL